MKRSEVNILLALGIMATCLSLSVAALFAYDVAEKRGFLAWAAAVPPTPTLGTRATPAWPAPTAAPTATSAPLPTNTLVIPREMVNAHLLGEIEQKMVELRKLSPRQTVTKRFLTGEELRRQLDLWFAQDNPAHELYAERELYLALDFLQEDDDFERIKKELMAQSIAGLYNPEDKHLYIVSERWNMTAAEEMTFAHEFIHAMQDQHYNLLSLDVRAPTRDAKLAVLALIEGDATLSMALYAFGNLSQADIDEITYRAAQLNQDNLAAVPEALKQITLFPYEAGLPFVQGIYVQTGDWSAVNAAFAVPPLSTEQIMHVEKYLVRPDVPVPVALPAMDDLMGGTWHEIARGVLGEFLLGLHLQQRIPKPEALKAAAGWGGDTYALLVDDRGRRLLVMRSVWDTPADAQEFFGAYSQAAGSYLQAERALDQPGKTYWRLPDREIYVSQHGRDVLVIAAPDTPTLDRALSWFPDY